MKNLLKIVATAILFFGLSSSATAANTVNKGLTQLTTKPLADSPYALDCKEAVGGKNCSLVNKNKFKNLQLLNQGNGNTEGYAIATDNSGNVYIAGETTVGINGQQQHGWYDYFIIKYDVKGNMQWTRQSGATGGDTEGYGVAIDNNSSNVYVIGLTTVGINGQQKHGDQDCFVVVYDFNGKMQWTQQVGASGGQTFGFGITTDNDDNVYITGLTSVGLYGQQQNGIYDYFLVKYTPNGKEQWTKQAGAYNGETNGFAIATDSSSNVYITGCTYVGINGQHQHGKMDYFLVKYTPNGKEQWTKQVGAFGGNTCSNGIAIDSNGNVYIIGTSNVGIDGQKQNGSYDYFIAKYTKSGAIQWSNQVGVSRGTTEGRGITIDNNNVYITGDTDVGINGQQQNGIYDYFLVKYYPNGKIQWTQQIGASGGLTIGNGITTDNSGSVYVTGTTTVGINGQSQNGSSDVFTVNHNFNNGAVKWSKQVGG